MSASDETPSVLCGATQQVRLPWAVWPPVILSGIILAFLFATSVTIPDYSKYTVINGYLLSIAIIVTLLLTLRGILIAINVKQITYGQLFNWFFRIQQPKHLGLQCYLAFGVIVGFYFSSLTVTCWWYLCLWRLLAFLPLERDLKSPVVRKLFIITLVICVLALLLFLLSPYCANIVSLIVRNPHDSIIDTFMVPLYITFIINGVIIGGVFFSIYRFAGGRCYLQQVWQEISVNDVASTGRNVLSSGIRHYALSIIPVFILMIIAIGSRTHFLPQAALWTILLSLLGLLLAHWPPFRRFTAIAFLHEEVRASGYNEKGRQPFGWYWCFAGFIMLCIGIWLLEHGDHFYFTQDDNLSALLPLYLHACRSAFSGHYATWNGFQYMGLPMASSPISSFAYPPIYLSYALATFVFGNEYLTVEIFIILHLCIAYFCLFWLSRLVNLRPILALTVSLSFTLSGFFLILGRSWGTVMAVTVWLLPLCIMAVLVNKEQVMWKWVIVTGCIIAGMFLVGHFEMALYQLMFFVLLLVGQKFVKLLPLRKLLWVIPALSLGIALTLPVLWPQAKEASRVYHSRTAEAGQPIQRCATSFLLPYPLVTCDVPFYDSIRPMYGPVGWGEKNNKSIGQLYYSGTIFYALFVLVLILLPYMRRPMQFLKQNIWLGLGFLILILALGGEAGLWDILHILPLFSKFRGPFKLLAILNLSVLLGGAIIFERVFQHTKYALRKSIFMASLVAGLLLFNCVMPHTSFFYWHYDPYPRLPKLLSAAIITPPSMGYTERVYSSGIERDSDKLSVFSMQLDIPTVYRSINAMGYDENLLANMPENVFALKQIKKNPEATFRVYGIRWIIRYKLKYTKDRAFNSLSNVAILRYRLPGIELWELTDVDAMAFPVSSPRQALPYMVYGQGIKVDLSHNANGGLIVVNFLHRPWMRAYADGKPIPISADAWKRILVNVPPGSHLVNIVYEIPWFEGVVAMVLLLFFTCFVWAIIFFRFEKPFLCQQKDRLLDAK